MDTSLFPATSVEPLMPIIEVFQGDITTLAVDAIVNAANEGLLGGGGVDGAIHAAAGLALLEECRRIPADERGCRCPTGEARITGAGRLPCKKVIHTVGPIWHGGEQGESALLAACYRHSLELAATAGLESIAFPNISTGVYGYPKKLAEEIAMKTVCEFIDSATQNSTVKKVTFVCSDCENYALYLCRRGTNRAACGEVVACDLSPSIPLSCPYLR